MSDAEKVLGQSVNLNINLPTLEEVHHGAANVLFQLDGDHEVGIEPGGFTSRIIEACCHADEMNLSRLALGFPHIANAVHIYKNVTGGVELLRRLATKTPSTQPGEGFSPKGN